jgi:hypothetical protein
MVGEFARRAALALLQWYQASSDPAQNIGLLEKAAALKDRAGELPPSKGDLSPRAPDVQTRTASRIAALASIETNVPSMIDGEAVVLGVDRIADFNAQHSWEA